MTGMRTFVVVWIGQFASMIGTNLGGFALGVYVYQQTGSAIQLGSVFAIGLLPAILASPMAGSFVDRWGSKRALLLSNTGAMAITLTLALLLFTDSFAIWHVYVAVAGLSLLSAFEGPAFGALVPQLAPKNHLGRANGMRMFALAVSELLAPVSAGFLLLVIGIEGIVLIDGLSFGLALITLLAVRVPGPRPRQPQEGPGEKADEARVEFRAAWRYVTARRGLLALMIFFGAVNFSAGFVDLLLTPLVLSFASSDALGLVLTIGGLGMLASSALVSVWGGPKRRVRGLLGLSLVLAAATVIGSLRPNVAMIAVAAFLFMGALAAFLSTNQSIWQAKVEPGMLGRVGALQNMVISIPQLIAYCTAGVLAERVFEPLVGRDAVASPGLTVLIGDGPGRGIALLIMITGGLIVLSVTAAALHPRLRHLENELPDQIPDEQISPSSLSEKV
ncbi:MFS family permease [Streptosporangium becharense]|uniref:MFS family permease n=1 Tax=Streptosporangium becharense TaxID=1816182 RepID=A0A7W9IBE8_9ACTN|nr:MFS transporter [Streptosporangium becharense]MBB2914119.1 MFS family permease [Streptosporangium becharense]MBB5817146.1 MFS family permease [Streptosporangium becharense]